MYAAKSKFLSTPSVRRATRPASITTAGENNFYPRPPRGGRLPQQAHTGAGMGDFYPRPPRGGRHRRCHRMSLHKTISIHALREVGDGLHSGGLLALLQFLSTPSARRATGNTAALSVTTIFLSTPSARRATRRTAHTEHSMDDFYPRPPRGGRRRQPGTNPRLFLFLSTPSARRATYHPAAPHPDRPISIHALREEGDPRASFSRSFGI